METVYKQQIWLFFWIKGFDWGFFVEFDLKKSFVFGTFEKGRFEMGQLRKNSLTSRVNVPIMESSLKINFKNKIQTTSTL